MAEQTGLAKPTNWIEVRHDSNSLVNRLRTMIVNGNKLSEPEIYALANYAQVNDLNPFAGECYVIPGKGCIPGIAGWRKKAQEQLMWEAKQVGELGAHFTCEYFPASDDEARFAPGTDIAWKVVLHDWLSNKRWRMALLDTLRMLEAAKVANPYEEAKKLVGPEPVWTGVGVVFASENFAGDKMDRNERAKKRGEKLALRKRFPRIDLPDTEIDDESAITVIQPQQQFKTTQSTNSILNDLGFDIAPEEHVEEIHEDEFPAPAAPYTREDAEISVNAKTARATKEMIDKTSANFAGREISSGKKGVIAPLIESCFATGDATIRRRAVQKYLTGKDSIRDMSDAQLIALYQWLKPSQDSGGLWMPCPEAVRDAEIIWAETIKADGKQMELLEANS
jgi:hypothetical protein